MLEHSSLQANSTPDLTSSCSDLSGPTFAPKVTVLVFERGSCLSVLAILYIRHNCLPDLDHGSAASFAQRLLRITQAESASSQSLTVFFPANHTTM